MRNGWSIMVERAAANQKRNKKRQSGGNRGLGTYPKDEPFGLLALVVLGVAIAILMTAFA
jgi:hypothetical protein